MNEAKPNPIRLPTLPTALRLYLLVVLGTLAITYGLSSVVPDIPFLRLVTAVFVLGGLLILTMILTGSDLRVVFGYAPRIMFLITGFLAGIAIFLPATWLLFLFSQILGGVFGNLPAARDTLKQVTTVEGQFAIYGVIIPLCQGLLFFGFIQNAARGIGLWRSVLLTGLLFGLYGFFSASFQLGVGFPAFPGTLLVGIVAAALAMRSGSPFVAVLVVSGFNLGGLIYPLGFINSLSAGGDILSIQWLTSVLVAGFVVFLLVQLSRIFGTPRGALNAKRPIGFWWSPLLVILLLTVVLIVGEINSRRQNQIVATPPPASGSTLPPGAPTASQTPKAAN